MLAKLGPLVTAVAGSIGGMTMQRSPWGTVARNKPLPILRRSQYSSQARQRAAAASLAWRFLPPESHTLWNNFAATQSWFNRFGDPVEGSGYLAFLKNNMASHYSASSESKSAFRLEPPGSTVSLMPEGLSLTWDPEEEELILGSSDSEVNETTSLFVFASAPVSTGRNRAPSNMPFLGQLTPTTGLPIVLNTPYLALHGTLPDPEAQTTMFLRIQAVNHVTLWPGLSTTIRLSLAS